MRYRFLVGLTAWLLTATTASIATDQGAALYKKKCAGCHGSQGEGKPAVKAPTLKGTVLDVDQIVKHLTKGEVTSKPPHNKGMAGLSGEQGKAVADYIRTLN